jgi:hypothetical protein
MKLCDQGFEAIGISCDVLKEPDIIQAIHQQAMEDIIAF